VSRKSTSTLGVSVAGPECRRVKTRLLQKAMLDAALKRRSTKNRHRLTTNPNPRRSGILVAIV